ncbi:MAG: hypothetical protein WDM85_13230 [Caulobacteraceae bacterium]
MQIDLDPQALQSKGLSAQDVENTIAAQDQILPAGHGQDRLAAVHRVPQRLAGHRRRAEQSADPLGQRRDHLRPRRRPCARRLAAAAERRSRQRRARGADHGPEGRLDLHPVHHPGRPRTPCRS